MKDPILEYPTDYIDRVICGDCIDVMRQMPDGCVDLVLTDPPYDESTHKGGMFSAEIRFGNVSFESLDILPIIPEFLRLAKRWVIVFVPVETLGLIKQAYPEEYIRGGIWDRIINSPQISGDRPAQACEGIAILHNKGRKKWNGGGKAAIWKYYVPRGQKVHDTQKPLKLFNHLLCDFSQPGESVFDPFVGSGTTAVACIRNGCHYIDIDISPDYCAIAEQRIRVERSQPDLPFANGGGR